MRNEKVKVQSKKVQHFMLYSIPCREPFVVSRDKTEAFLNVKPNPEIRKQQKEMAEQIKNNLVVDGPGPVLKKVRKSTFGKIIIK